MNMEELRDRAQYDRELAAYAKYREGVYTFWLLPIVLRRAHGHMKVEDTLHRVDALSPSRRAILLGELRAVLRWPGENSYIRQDDARHLIKYIEEIGTQDTDALAAAAAAA